MDVIAGVSGKTGAEVAGALLARGRKVRVVVRDARRGEGWRERGAEVAVASLADEAALARALAGASGVYLLLPEDPAAPDLRDRRRRMADAMAAAVRASAPEHVVFLSAAQEVGLARELRHAERALGAAARALTVIRACFFQENVAAALPAARLHGVYPSFLPADLAFPAVAARDIGRLAAGCLLEPPTARGEIVDLLGPTTTARRLAAALGAALGAPLALVEIPARDHVAALTAAGLPGPYAEALAEMFAAMASGGAPPRGDRTVVGATTVDEILPALVQLIRA